MVATVVVAVLVVAGGAGATGSGSGTNHGTNGDYTVFLPNEIDHYPGDQNRANGSIQHLAALDGTFEGTPSPKGYEAAGFLIIGNEDVDFSQCSTENTAAFGVDRENDDEGTKTDESLLAARENSQFNEHEIVIDFFDQGDLAGEPIAINDVDEVVAVQNECYTQPTEPGWYQINGFLNGTGYNGNQFEVTLDSHYYYVCECGSEQEAREKLGPPPSESGSSDSSEATATATATAEPTATATPESTATATAEAAATATATPAATPTATAEPTATATVEAAATATATATAEATATNAGGGSDDGGQAGGQDTGGSAATGTATAVGGGNPGGAPATPTVGAGPGFGAAAALAGLLAAALLALRRD
ncbi:PGF-CTERM sorting domain-containing protein [Haloglomus litoreum]|uniref:PGF-CTERM sorting domain-containing protein n=1 Tax=Haloglomus litoreum TaxID=3034026 RepID=UPI0023E79EAB|nr:PGF-CTERM sorting domain-containing protein [Haloglomus sp. DT116]